MCQVTTGMRWLKPMFVVGVPYSPSAVTNIAKVESMSAEWMFQGTTWTSCLFALVSVWGDGCGLLSIIELTILTCQSSNIHGQGHMKPYLQQLVMASTIIWQTEMEWLPASITKSSETLVVPEETGGGWQSKHDWAMARSHWLLQIGPGQVGAIPSDCCHLSLTPHTG